LHLPPLWAHNLLPMNPPREEAVQFAKTSKRENRVYIANLNYEIDYQELTEFMSAGECYSMLLNQCVILNEYETI